MHTNNFYINKYSVTILLLGGFLIVMAPQIAHATSPFDQSPVPTYGAVSALPDTTTVTIPANLMAEWRGLFTLPTGSLLTRSASNPRDLLLKSLQDAEVRRPTRTYKYNPKAIYGWTGTIAATVNTQSAEPSIKIEDGKVTEFTPPRTGKALDRYNSTLKIIESLQNGQSTIELSVQTTKPQKELKDLNNLGLTEIIGRGESKFGGSPFNRRHNINVGIEKMKGIIVKPGEEFSFNKYLGPVEAHTGFLPELVIKKTGTVPEFGGGLCQVSSTAWRAAMHAGLPITQRRNHSYAVQYYAPQGTDATIYPGVIDMKFTNDTGHNILIWPYLKDKDHLMFDFYGTFDDRKVVLETPIQYDRKPDGSMKAAWTRKITKDGQTNSETFRSVYQPPALFHKQETFVTPQAGTPTPPPAQTNSTPPPITTTPETPTNANTAN
ncbi:MAG: VanW family protein [bacterium]|nr:VanW family protein [bacterium]